MSITREQLADLQPGDVVELICVVHSNVRVRGELRPFPLGQHPRASITGFVGLTLGPGLVLRRADGGVAAMWTDANYSLVIISRAPRPLYVNHDRTEPVPGDVVRFVSDDHPDDSYTNAFLPRTEQDGLPWVSLTHDPGERYSDENADCRHLSGWRMVLLVDGETGQVVP